MIRYWKFSILHWKSPLPRPKFETFNLDFLINGHPILVLMGRVEFSIYYMKISGWDGFFFIKKNKLHMNKRVCPFIKEVKVGKLEKKYGVLNSSKKWTKLTTYPEHLLFSTHAQNSELRSFFGRIENAINCLRDLPTFRSILKSLVMWCFWAESTKL